ncbi:MAG: hypothetical protein J6Q65_00215, partial [Lentisphaeria bacterium]|nr:hypothetical protein [Lentisphaeria bacterium]
MKILKLFAAVLATAVLTLSGQEKNNLQITAPSRQSDVFFRLTAAEKQALLDRVKLVHAVPEGAVDLGDKSIKTAFKTEGKIIAGALQSSTIWHVMGLKKQQNTIVLKTAKTIDEIISGLVLEPDYLVLAEEFDPAKIRAFLLDEKNVPELYHTPKKKGEIVENYDNCATHAEGTNLRIMSYNILANIWGNGKMQTQYRV